MASYGLTARQNEVANHIPRFIKGALLYILAFDYLCCFGNDAFEIGCLMKITGRCLLVAVSNGDRYGGGMKVTPNASRFDNLFDLCLVGNITKWELITFSRVFKGTHLNHLSTFFQNIFFSHPGKSWVYADGERKLTSSTLFHY